VASFTSPGRFFAFFLGIESPFSHLGLASNLKSLAGGNDPLPEECGFSSELIDFPKVINLKGEAQLKQLSNVSCFFETYCLVQNFSNARCWNAEDYALKFFI